MTEPSKQLAKDVAIELARRNRRRKLLVLLLLAALVIAALLFLRFGLGWGIGGGKGTGALEDPGTGVTMIPHDVPQRCTIRVAADGISVNGVKKTRDEAVELCKKTEGAMVTVTGDARQGDWDELRAALEAVRVKIFMRGQISD